MIITTKYLWQFKGTTALVFNNPAAMLLKPADIVEHLKWDAEHFRDKLFKSADGDVILPGQEIKKRLLQGAKHVKTKPPKGFRSWAPLIEGSMLFDDAVIEVEYAKIVPWTAIVSLNPSLGMKSPKGPRVRPLIPLPWAATCEVTTLDERLTLDAMSEIAEETGLKIGFGDALKLDYGRAEIRVKAN